MTQLDEARVEYEKALRLVDASRNPVTVVKIVTAITRYVELLRLDARVDRAAPSSPRWMVSTDGRWVYDRGTVVAQCTVVAQRTANPGLRELADAANRGPLPDGCVPVKFLVTSHGQESNVRCDPAGARFRVDAFTDNLANPHPPDLTSIESATAVAHEVNRRKARLAELRAEEFSIRESPIEVPS